MNPTVIILAGGLGTRLGLNNIPKTLVEVNGIPVLRYILREISRLNPSDCIVTAFHLAAQLEFWIDSESSGFSYPIKVVHEDYLAGTRKSLLAALDHVKTDEIVVLLGDVVFDADLSIFWKKWKEDNKSFGFITCMNSYLQTCDVITKTNSGYKVRYKDESIFFSPHSGALSGILFAKTDNLVSVLKEDDSLDFEKCILTKSDYEDIEFLPSLDWFCDIGTPERLLHANKSLEMKPFSSTKVKQILLCDRDDTILKDPKENLQNDPDFFDYFYRALSICNLRRIPVIVMTNQSRIGKGVYNEAEHADFYHRMFSALHHRQLYITDYFYCPHDPLKEICLCRKPANGMIEQLANRFIDSQNYRFFYVGDSLTDYDFAKANSIEFHHVRQDEICEISSIHNCMSVRDTRTFFETLQNL